MSEMTTTTASMLNLDRPKPHNEEAEIAVLGAMLFSTEAVSSAIGALKLENAFYRPAHQTIFNAMVELTAGKSEVALDPLVVSDHLERSGKLEEVGGRAYIAQLMDSVPTAANIDFYVEIVSTTTSKSSSRTRFCGISSRHARRRSSDAMPRRTTSMRCWTASSRRFSK